mmetsp:Transcript_21891/g.38741  ORF Transcript_21891/g.38741 Transcript_21891/m.38741 type:complete len:465 (+) Transcript_21891:80-1474(+)
MPLMETVLADIILPVSGIMLVLYPAALLLWMEIGGRTASTKASGVKDSCLDCEDDVKMSSKVRPQPTAVGRPTTALLAGAFFCGAPVFFLWGGFGCGFLSSGGSRSSIATRPPVLTAPARVEPWISTTDLALGSAAAAATMAAVAFSRSRGPALRSMPVRRVYPAFCPMQTPSSSQVASTTQSRPSLWHDVDLFVRNWLDVPTGLLRYVNEMPIGCLDKYEVQPDVPHNAIREDPKGSARLAAFGRPVPFNYGCFPQTFRDPEQLCELYGAPGDDDPLDVLDLGFSESGVGEVVSCRPLGAVCLIDEGKADWKILAVNTATNGPLAHATSVEEVERLAPGRIKQCLSWIDDFKRSSGKDTAKLHWEIHGIDRAMKLIQDDHASWRSLVAEVDQHGHARGHWIQQADGQKAKPQVLQVAWSPVSMATPWLSMPRANVFAGASKARATSALCPRPLSRRPDADHHF